MAIETYGQQIERIAQVLDGAFDDSNDFLKIQGQSQVVQKSVTFTGAAGLGAIGTVPLFAISGSVLAAVIAICTVDLVGATATHSVGPAAGVTALIPSAVGTTIDAGLVVDSTGLLAAVGAPNVTPTKILTNAQNILATIGVANVTAGAITYLCFYKPLTTGAVVTAS